MSQSQYHLFSLPQEILDTLVPRNIANQTTAPPPPRVDSATPVPQPTAGSRACNICLGASFVDVDDQRAHFRSDWHRYNVKIRLGGGEPVSEARFAQLVDGAHANYAFIFRLLIVYRLGGLHLGLRVLIRRRVGRLGRRLRARPKDPQTGATIISRRLPQPLNTTNTGSMVSLPAFHTDRSLQSHLPRRYISRGLPL